MTVTVNIPSCLLVSTYKMAKYQKVGQTLSQFAIDINPQYLNDISAPERAIVIDSAVSVLHIEVGIRRYDVEPTE